MGLLVDWTHDYLHDSLTQLHLREQCGAIRECHGDLHARNIVRWRGQLIPFDGLEFDPKLRWIDVMNDVAFLVMDLMAHERQDLACAFLNAYLERTGDYDGVRHLAFYSVYRSLVRAMVDCLGAENDLDASRGFSKTTTDADKDCQRIRKSTRADAVHHAWCFGLWKSWMSERLIPAAGSDPNSI